METSPGTPVGPYVAATSPDVFITSPFPWGTLRNTDLVPDPGYFIKNPGPIGGASYNPYSKFVPPIATEMAFRSTNMRKWVQGIADDVSQY